MRNFRKNVTTTRATLLIAVVLSVVVLAIKDMFGHVEWSACPFLALSTYLMLELNTRHSLMRARSTMVSSTFLTLTLMTFLSELSIKQAAVTSLFILSLVIIFYAYHQHRAQMQLSFAFAVISIGSLFYVEILYFIPIYLITLMVYVLRLNLKGFSAVIVALLFPYWIALPFKLYDRNLDDCVAHFMPLADISSSMSYDAITLGTAICYFFLFVLYIVGMTHFIMFSFKEKIQTRQYFNLFSVLSLCLFVAIAVLPGIREWAMPWLIVVVSPLVAHLFTFSDSRIANYTFIVTLVIVALMIAGDIFIAEWHQPLSELIKVYS